MLTPRMRRVLNGLKKVDDDLRIYLDRELKPDVNFIEVTIHCAVCGPITRSPGMASIWVQGNEMQDRPFGDEVKFQITKVWEQHMDEHRDGRLP